MLRPKYVLRTPRRIYEKRSLPGSLSILLERHFPGVTIEIQAPTDGALVTVIDILLMMDKQEGPLRIGYLSHRRRLLESPAHLVEIDLLRSGERFPLPEPAPREPYCVMVSRATNRARCEVWPFKLTDPLPTIPIPLGQADQDATLDLNRIFKMVHSLFGYDLDVQYERGPEVPLEAGQLNWAQRMVQMWKDQQE